MWLEQVPPAGLLLPPALSMGARASVLAALLPLPTTHLRTIADPPLAESPRSLQSSTIKSMDQLLASLEGGTVAYTHSPRERAGAAAIGWAPLQALGNSQKQDREGPSSKSTTFRLLVPATNLAGTVLPNLQRA